ncbi:MAG: TIGR03435 family protein [Bryobacteraceae bacterium]
MPALVQALESVAGRPVLDETGITGKYDFTLTYDTHDPQGAVAALRKLGFKVEPARRPIEFLVVTKAE